MILIGTTFVLVRYALISLYTNALFLTDWFCLFSFVLMRPSYTISHHAYTLHLSYH